MKILGIGLGLVGFAVLAASPLFASAQVKMSRQYLYVTTIEKDTIKTEGQTVFMGTKDRTDICFFVTFMFCFEKLRPVNPRIKGDYRYIGISSTGDKYLIRQLRAKDGYCIWLTNLSGGFPHYFMTPKQEVEL